MGQGGSKDLPRLLSMAVEVCIIILPTWLLDKFSSSEINATQSNGPMGAKVKIGDYCVGPYFIVYLDRS